MVIELRASITGMFISRIVPEMTDSSIPELAISGIYQKRYLTFLAYTKIAGEYYGNVYFSYSTRNDHFW